VEGEYGKNKEGSGNISMLDETVDTMVSFDHLDDVSMRSIYRKPRARSYSKVYRKIQSGFHGVKQNIKFAVVCILM